MDNKPKVYTDREKRKNNSFIFISYSHRDKEVMDVLYRLFDAGVNYWYDVEFKAGDQWDAEAKKQMRNMNCIGAIIFASNQTVISDACHEEVAEMIELKETRERGFSTIPILIGYTEPAKVYEDTRNRIAKGEFEENIKNNKKYTLDEKIEAFEVITAGNKVISPRYSAEDYKWLDGVVDTLRQLGVVEEQMFYLKNTPFTTKLHAKFDPQKNTYILEFGSYPFDADVNEEKITWKAIWQEKNIVTLVSEYVLDYDFKDNVENVIEAITNSFDRTEFIEEIGIINEKQLEQYKEYIGEFITTDYADVKRGQLLKLNFIKKTNTDNEYVLVNVNGSRYDEINKISKNNYGIRLIMKINNEKI